MRSIDTEYIRNLQFDLLHNDDRMITINNTVYDLATIYRCICILFSTNEKCQSLKKHYAIMKSYELILIIAVFLVGLITGICI